VTCKVTYVRTRIFVADLLNHLQLPALIYAVTFDERRLLFLFSLVVVEHWHGLVEVSIPSRVTLLPNFSRSRSDRNVVPRNVDRILFLGQVWYIERVVDYLIISLQHLISVEIWDYGVIHILRSIKTRDICALIFSCFVLSSDWLGFFWLVGGVW